MGFFGDSTPKRVTQDEMREIMRNLYGKLDERERSEVEKLFRSDLNESGIEAGISQAEFTAAMTWLRENQKKHVLEEDDITLIEKYFTEHLKD
ncbi:MAG: hypothetical protein KBC62_03995 [Candidatus Pacebacteria bacterium]|nr:hypothetical protein [Candidatus Paceibacterota bacterium]